MTRPMISPDTLTEIRCSPDAVQDVLRLETHCEPAMHVPGSIEESTHELRSRSYSRGDILTSLFA